MKIITHSALSEFKNCRRRYYYRYIQGLTPTKKKTSLQMGTAFHYGLELYYQGQSWEDCLAKAEGLMREVDTSFWSQDDLNALETQVWTIRAMLSGYFAHFDDRDQFEQIIPEFEFKVPVVNPETGAASRTFEHCGKVDGLFKEYGQWWLREFKTASQLDKQYFDRLALDTQITSYVEAAQAKLGIEIVGIIYTVARKPSIKQKQTESLEEFKDRLILDYLQRPEFYFYQERIHRTADDFTEWRFERWETARDIADAERTNRWYRNTSYCNNFGGCPYMPLCCQGTEMLPLYEVKDAHEELSKEITHGHAA